MPAPFLKTQILDRLVAMLNFNVAQLVGPKCTELKVQDPQKYGFNPKELLSIILEIYLHLYQPTFVEGMVREGRSYQKGHFDKACYVFRKFMLKPEDEILLIEKLVADVEAGKKKEVEQEQEMGEVPDEFMGQSITLFLSSFFFL
jgi:ubiquitin conjugation factor E4 B